MPKLFAKNPKCVVFMAKLQMILDIIYSMIENTTQYYGLYSPVLDELATHSNISFSESLNEWHKGEAQSDTNSTSKPLKHWIFCFLPTSKGTSHPFSIELSWALIKLVNGRSRRNESKFAIPQVKQWFLVIIFLDIKVS